MKILFIQIKTENPEGPIFPLGLAYLGSALSSEHEVRAIDMNIERNPYQTLSDAGKSFKPDIVCLSIRNIKVAMPGEHVSSGQEVYKIVKRIKSSIPNAKIVAGGAGFSLYAEAFMHTISEIECGVVGEGEKALSHMLNTLPGTDKLKGLIYRKDNQIYFTGIAERPDFASMPWPRRDLFPMSRYRQFPTSVGVMTKRGCPFRCIHCSDIYLLGKNVRIRNPSDVVEELKYLKKDHGVSRFMFADQTFNHPVEYTKELLESMIASKLDLRWTAYFTPMGLDEEMLNLFKRSGCFMISFSPDCCTDNMLNGLKKGFLMEDLCRANRLIKKAEIPVTYNFMLGLPGETLASLLRTLLFIIRTKAHLKKLFALHGLFIVPVRIYPHTVLRKMAIQNGLIQREDDLLRPRFAQSTSKLVNIADDAIISGVSLLWKLKHGIFKERLSKQ